MNIFKRKKKDSYSRSFDFGNFVVDLYYDESDAEKCYAEIHTPNPCLDVRLSSTHEAYGLLMAAAMDNDKDCIAGYCSLLSICATMLSIDTPFVGIVQRGFEDWSNRKEEEARIAAEKISLEDEESAQILMGEAASIAELPLNEQIAYVKDVINRLKDKTDNETIKKE